MHDLAGIDVGADVAVRMVTLDRPDTLAAFSEAGLNQHLRADAVRALGYGPAGESRSHDVPEYQAVGGRLRPKEEPR